MTPRLTNYNTLVKKLMFFFNTNNTNVVRPTRSTIKKESNTTLTNLPHTTKKQRGPTMRCAYEMLHDATNESKSVRIHTTTHKCEIHIKPARAQTVTNKFNRNLI